MDYVSAQSTSVNNPKHGKHSMHYAAPQEPVDADAQLAMLETGSAVEGRMKKTAERKRTQGYCKQKKKLASLLLPLQTV